MSATDDRGPGQRVAPTIRDVARLAEVSIGTASKALNANGRLRQETRDKVIQVARQIGYRPNDLAQSLHRSKSMTVGIITNDSFGRFSFPIVEALEERLADQGIAVFMCNATDDPARERQHLDQLMGKRIDGLVVTARRADKRPPIGPFAHGLPVVYVYSQADDPDALSLVPDDEGGAVLAVSHLVGLGRTRIAHITGPERFDAVRLRRSGYARTLAASGLPARPDYYLPGAWSEAWGRDAVGTLFAAGREHPDALFCGNDQIARGAADALRERGIDVPRDVAIVGFDNWEVMTAASRPPLSSVDMNLRAMGLEAGESLLAMIAGKRISGLRRLPCTLQVRGSSQPDDKDKGARRHSNAVHERKSG
ncbi:MAG: LacI family DNA-binding transcriptional regulator [Devosia nanyangense]|uniref:LacI family DNA-binding transcriptional regulator n=1 Tax=Devosia nanyangense TaxID=1228055 RepID=A0A933L5I5_9HYPH|nr:LacI family DNA-binding transcriptional regulator [Devosia nanyangense]